MASDTKTEMGKRTPPSISFTTVQTFLDRFENETIPTQIDRSVMQKLPGGAQTLLIATLKFLGFLSDNNTPESDFYAYVAASKEDREGIWKRVLTSKYAFLLESVEVERTTTAIVAAKFRDQGIGGDTIRKAVTFFLHAAKAANIKVSPHVKAPRPPQVAKPTRSGEAKKKEYNNIPSGSGQNSGSGSRTPAVNQTPYEMLIGILNARMTDEEQSAVWTLIRYLKKAELASE